VRSASPTIFAFGHENVAGFQRVFEDAGGKVVQKIFTPLNAPDYGTYLSQFKNADCLYTGHAGSNGLKIIRQISEYGLKGKFTIVGGFTPIDESLFAADGRRRRRLLFRVAGYSAALDNPINKAFVAEIQKDYKVDPASMRPRPMCRAKCSSTL